MLLDCVVGTENVNRNLQSNFEFWNVVPNLIWQCVQHGVAIVSKSPIYIDTQVVWFQFILEK